MFFSKLDIYNHIPKEFRVKTSCGAFLSLIIVVLILYLSFTEVFTTLKVETIDTLFVNSTLGMSLPVEFDLSFPDIDCEHLSIDVLDSLGQKLDNVVSTVFKHNIDSSGRVVGRPSSHPLGDSVTTESQVISAYSPSSVKKPLAQDLTKTLDDQKQGSTNITCGDCFGADTADRPCCNSCQDVKEAYIKKGWSFDPTKITPCQEQYDVAYENSGGCRIFGSLFFKPSTYISSGAIIQFSPHTNILTTASPVSASASLESLLSFTYSSFNISHTISVLDFGPRILSSSSSSSTSSNSAVDNYLVDGLLKKLNVDPNSEYLKYVPSLGGRKGYRNQRSSNRRREEQDDLAARRRLRPQDTDTLNIVAQSEYSGVLTGYETMIDDGHAIHTYYIRLVPTIYKFLKKKVVQNPGQAASSAQVASGRQETSRMKEVQSYQYSVTQHQREIAPGSLKGQLPAVIFVLEVSPIHAEVCERRKSWLQLLTSISTLIGAVVGMGSILDKVVFRLTKKVFKERGL